MAEVLIGAAALAVVAPLVWAVARLALRPFLRTRDRADAAPPAMGRNPMKPDPFRPVPEDRPCWPV